VSQREVCVIVQEENKYWSGNELTIRDLNGGRSACWDYFLKQWWCWIKYE